ncbi:MAG: GspE/PulE family protein [Candidatus Omnitrophota bacterium]|nr:GspE/PulE family protein [Candidatus Omnitrophota bacterium]
MATLQERLVEIMINNRLVSRQQIDKVLKIQKDKGLSIKQILINEGIVKEKDLLSLFAKELYIPPLDLSRYKIDKNIIDLIPRRVASQYHLIAVSKIGNTLTVGMSDPMNIFALDDVKALTGYEIQPVMCLDAEIEKSIAKYYKTDKETISGILKETPESETLITAQENNLAVDVGTALAESEKAPIVKIVDLMIVQALKKRVSDIHIEPEEAKLRIRYRIDGQLYDVFTLAKNYQNAVLARLKIVSGLDITESRLPQDGRFKIRMEGREVDFRVSALPTIFGQKFVLRVLDRSNITIGLERLGFSSKSLEIFREAINKPYGMILVTGPTGSGKSTTLYSVLSQLNTPQRNIITIEDPVEYQVEGITQIQVKSDIGLTFASGLRSLLRQSPDVIMVGEIRDSETADIAVKASLTGQLIFSTLHTNDATGAISRLVDMGIEPFLVASSLVMACAQRLMRAICPQCKEPADIPKEFLEKIGIKVTPNKVFYRGRGCDHCNNTGYFGRMGILEVLFVDDNIRDMIINKAMVDDIKNYAVAKCGMVTLRDDAYSKFAEGLTTIEEVIRVTTED